MGKIKTLGEKSEGERIFMIPVESSRIQESKYHVRNRENLTTEDITEFKIEKMVSYESAAVYPIEGDERMGDTAIMDLRRLTCYELPDGEIPQWKPNLLHPGTPISKFRAIYTDMGSAIMDIDNIAREITNPDIHISEIVLSVTVEDSLSDHQRDTVLHEIKDIDKYEYHYHTTFHFAIPGEYIFDSSYISQRVSEINKNISQVLQDIHKEKLAVFDALLLPGAIDKINNTHDLDIMAHESLFDEIPDVSYRPVGKDGHIITNIIEVEDSSRAVLGYIQVDEKKDKIVAVSKTPFPLPLLLDSNPMMEEDELIDFPAQKM